MKLARIAILLFVLLTALAGCGRHHGSKGTHERTKPRPEAPNGLVVEHPDITVKDPNGLWTFHVVALRASNSGSETGPSDLLQAHGTYRRGQDPPVHMQAQRLRLDQVKQQVTMDGKVTLDTGLVRIESNHLRYDLKNAKVAGFARGETDYEASPARALPTSPARQGRITMKRSYAWFLALALLAAPLAFGATAHKAAPAGQPLQTPMGNLVIHPQGPWDYSFNGVLQFTHGVTVTSETFTAQVRYPQGLAQQEGHGLRSLRGHRGRSFQRPVHCPGRG